MNKSFENKLKSRLSNHRGVPADGAKDDIFARLDAERPALTWVYHYLGGALLLTSLFMVGGIHEKSSAGLSIRENEPQEFIPNDGGFVVESFPLSNPAEPTDEVAFHPIVSGEQDPGFSTMHSEIIGSETTRNQSSLIENPKSEDEKLAGINEYTKGPNQTKKAHLLDDEIPAGLMLLAARDEKKVRRVIPDQPKFLHPYLEGGAFFMYNRLKPNLDDEIYVGNFDSPFGMSISRVGFGLHVGLERQWNDLWSLRLGVLFNNYNQSYSFNVRETTPDSVIVGAEYLEPVFDTDSVVINKRVSTLGLKIQSVWNLPSRYNSLFVSFEYHRRVSQGPEFSYQDQTYQLSSSNQYLLEVGLRKRLFELPKGDLFVEPGIRYAVTNWQNQGIIAVKPFSVGVSLNYSLK